MLGPSITILFVDGSFAAFKCFSAACYDVKFSHRRDFPQLDAQ